MDAGRLMSDGGNHSSNFTLKSGLVIAFMGGHCEIVEKTKARYDAAVKELRELFEKKDAQRKEKLPKAIENSSRSFDEIMAFLKKED